MTRKHAVAIVGVAVVSFAIGISLGSPPSQHPDEKPRLESPAPPAVAAKHEQPSRSHPIFQSEDKIADIAEQTVIGVVNVATEKTIRTPGGGGGPFFNDPFFRQFFGPGFGNPSLPQQQRQSSLGSGVVVDTDGIILTNNHVIDDADEIVVTLSDGRSFDAEVIGTDPESDVGVLRLKDPPKDLKPLTFGDSDALRLGSTVLAIGNPFGVGQTVTMGIVSATGRANVGIVDYENFIQTDAAINPGNSGGALVNTDGELVGINTAILSRSGGYQGIGFAIPSNMARSIMQSLIDHGKVIRGWLGVMIQDLTPDLASALDVPEGTRGALVSDVIKDSPADRGGFEQGDIIVRVDGDPVESGAKLRNRVAISGVDQKVVFDILRDGKQKTLEVELGEREGKVASKGGSAGGGSEFGGLSLAPPTGDLARRFGFQPGAAGVVVTGVEPGSAAAHAGFRPGDRILEVNQQKISSIREFRDVYEDADDKLLVLVERGDGRLFIAFRKDGD